MALRMADKRLFALLLCATSIVGTGGNSPSLSGKCPEAMQGLKCLGQQMASCFVCSKSLRKQHTCEHEQAKFFCWMTRPEVSKVEKKHEFPEERHVQALQLGKEKKDVHYRLPKNHKEMMAQYHQIEQFGTCAEQCCEHVDPQGLALQLYETTFGKDPCNVKLSAAEKTFRLIAGDVCACLRCHCRTFQIKYGKGAKCAKEAQGSFWAVPTATPTKSPTRWQIQRLVHFGSIGKQIWSKHDKSMERECRGSWTVWSPCSSSCGASGSHVRHFVVNQTALYGGRECKFANYSKQKFPCNRNVSCPTSAPTAVPTLAPTAAPTNSGDARFQCESRGYNEKQCRKVGCCVFANKLCWSGGKPGSLCKNVHVPLLQTRAPTPRPSLLPHKLYSSAAVRKIYASTTTDLGESIWAEEKCSDFLQRHCVYMGPKECRACSHQITKALHKERSCSDGDISSYCFSARDAGPLASEAPSKAPTKPGAPTTPPTLAPTPHPCDDGGHGCEKRLGGLCYKAGDNGYMCGCEADFVCTKGCSAPHKGHECTLRARLKHQSQQAGRDRP